MHSEKRFYRRSRIPESQFRELVRLFAQDVSATDAAALVGLTRKSVTTIFLKLRRRMAEECERSSPLAVSRIRQDSSLASAHCVCGRCRRGLSFGSPVFGVLADEDKVFAQEIPDCRKPILRAIVRHRLNPALVPIDGWHGYDALVEAESSQSFRVKNDSPGISTSTRKIQSFWDFARQRLQKFNGVPNRTFYLHLKESEWRFNFSNGVPAPALRAQSPSQMCVGAQTNSAADGMYSELLRLIERNPL